MTTPELTQPTSPTAQATTTRAAAYVRVAPSRDADRDEVGIQRQVESCRAFIAAQGWELTGVYIDNDVSPTQRRPERARLFASLADLDAVVTCNMDRLTRQSTELEWMIDAFAQHNVGLYCTDTEPGGTVPTDVLRAFGAAVGKALRQ